MSVAEPNVQTILLGDAIERAPAAVFVADENGRYIAANAYACEMLGYDREELLALRVTDVAVNEEAAADYERMKRSGIHTGVTVLRCKDGSHLTMHFRAGETTVGGMQLYIGVCWPVESAG